MTQCRAHLGLARQNREGCEGVERFLRRFCGEELRPRNSSVERGLKKSFLTAVRRRNGDGLLLPGVLRGLLTRIFLKYYQLRDILPLTYFVVSVD
jgi:hypothetical protein